MTPPNTEAAERIAPPANPIKDPIRAFVFEQYPRARQKQSQDTDSLIESGIVDSMGILELVAFVESDFGIQVDDTDLTPENFESVEAIAAFVVAKQPP